MERLRPDAAANSFAAPAVADRGLGWFYRRERLIRIAVGAKRSARQSHGVS